MGGGVRARVFRRDLREHPGAHYEMCARPRSGAIFGHIHACDIRCLRSAVLQPPGRTPAVVARGTRAFCLVRAMPFAPWLVLRVAARRRSLSYALSRGAGFCLTRRCPVAEMDCARDGPRGFCAAMFGRAVLRVFVMCYLIVLAVPGASDLCFSRATMLRQCSREGAFCGWRCSRKGVPTGSARTPRSTLRDARAPVV